ncbi:MAG TPA: nucleotidyl transferase AbiEii/AbiGii toxin family protein [Candidatus Limnocylindria bacterium]|nr:nucleotidyl transferase AbiEii/AbiGii toxin family protein [Candidatus Limnocylindria bacterium]
MALFEPLFDALNRADVRYVVVGGVAVVLHGFARLTADVDLAIDLRPAEATKAIEAFTRLGLRPRLPVDPMGFADPAVRASWVRDKHMRVFTFLNPTNPMLLVDCFAEDVLPFDELWARSEVMCLASTTVRVASIADLIALKRRAARPQDQQDIEALQDILRRRRHHG